MWLQTEECHDYDALNTFEIGIDRFLMLCYLNCNKKKEKMMKLSGEKQITTTTKEVGEKVERHERKKLERERGEK